MSVEEIHGEQVDGHSQQPPCDHTARCTCCRLFNTDRVKILDDGSRLKLVNITASDNGIYSCRAENRAGAVDSSENFLLNVQGEWSDFIAFIASNQLKKTTLFIVKLDWMTGIAVVVNMLCTSLLSLLGVVEGKDRCAILHPVLFFLSSHSYPLFLSLSQDHSNQQRFITASTRSASTPISSLIILRLPGLIDRKKTFAQARFSSTPFIFPPVVPSLSLHYVHEPGSCKFAQAVQLFAL